MSLPRSCGVPEASDAPEAPEACGVPEASDAPEAPEACGVPEAALALDAPAALSTPHAFQALQAGCIAILATDTVYGLAALVGSKAATDIFALKGRPRDMPLPWLVNDVSALDEYAAFLPSYARALAEKHWPGAVTLVVTASDAALETGAVAADGTVALRCPGDAPLLALLQALGHPLACTSANMHGEPCVWRKRDIDQCFSSLPGYDELADECPGQRASTIVDCTGTVPRILRQGAIVL